MESYREYPIRCKSCGEQIACYAPDFEQAIQEGFTPEEALNQLGITDYCSRIAMINPVIVAFNMENRQVIEGFKSIDAAQDEDIQSGYVSQPIFSACMSPESDIPHRPVLRGATAGGMFQRYVKTRTPIAASSNAPDTATLEEALAAAEYESRPRITPIAMGIQIGGPGQAIGEAIEIEIPTDHVYLAPTTVGVPTINPDRTIPETLIHVGANKQTRVLNGRTFLAR